jgi:hydrogenase maturation protease
VAPLLVLAIGNPSRGDDAVGPALIDALRAAGVGRDGKVELMTDFQLQVEHALDLCDRRAVLFVDAARPGARGDGGVALEPVDPDAAPLVLSHAITPAAVLQVALRLGVALPPCWLLTIEGESFDLGTELSLAAWQRLSQACRLARGWLGLHGVDNNDSAVATHPAN